MRRAQIAVLILAVGAGGVAAVLATRSEQPVAPAPLPAVATVDVLVAKADIEVGRRLSAADVQWQAWPASSANALFMRRTDNPGAAAQVAGSIARSAFTGGEPIREAKLIRANGSGFMAALIRSGMRGISTDISPEAGVGGFILPNDHVDLILTRVEKFSGEESYHSETILTNVRVLAIDQTIEEKNGQRTVIGKIATLELSPAQAETLALARRLGSISLMLRSLRDAELSLAEQNSRAGRLDRAESVSVVRFGRGANAILK
jgi:pilus assembly protein CpaB